MIDRKWFHGQTQTKIEDMLLGYSRGFPSPKDSRDVTQLPQVEIQKMMNDQTQQVRKESSNLFENENLVTKMAEKFPC